MIVNLRWINCNCKKAMKGIYIERGMMICSSVVEVPNMYCICGRVLIFCGLKTGGKKWK